MVGKPMSSRGANNPISVAKRFDIAANPVSNKPPYLWHEKNKQATPSFCVGNFILPMACVASTTTNGAPLASASWARWSKHWALVTNVINDMGGGAPLDVLVVG